MKRLRTPFILALGLLVFPGGLRAQQEPQAEWDIEPLGSGGAAEYDFQTGLFTVTNGVLVKYGGAVLTADQAVLNQDTGEVVADGAVRIQQGDQLWASEHVRYNFKTRQMEATQFRTGQTPALAAGKGLHADLTNRVYYGTNALLTTDDVARPALKVRARRVKIIPGKKFVAYDAVLYAGPVPVFYFPYYTRSLGENENHFNFTPGYRSLFGPFVLGSYTWYLNNQLNGVVRLDYRQKRGPGAGADFNYDFGPWGRGSLSYYYIHDDEPNIDELGVPIPENRQRLYFNYRANPATNLYLLSQVRYESDVAMDRDFFEGDYRRDPQPSTFVEANKFWHNFSLDAYYQPQVNDFLQTVERLPDIRLTGFRQQVGSLPIYYESESSAGYYRQVFAVNAITNESPPGLNYEAARADTYHQLLLPETFFGWLNVTPRAGGRFTAYSAASGPGATTDQENRGVFNTGAEVTFKASRLWPGAESGLLDVNGLRHIIQPSANYVFVPNPTTPSNQLPQFDYELPSLWLLPLEFPDFNSIDAIDSQNVIRWGLANKLQTKRDGQVADLLDWSLYTDWRLRPESHQSTFSDVFSDLLLRPRSWLTLESLIRYDPNNGRLRMAYETLTFKPNNIWSWRLGQYYLADDLGAEFSPSPGLVGGNNVYTSTLYYRLDENWGFRMAHYFDALSGRLQEQAYTVYRDLRSMTVALTFLTRDNPTGPKDYTFAFTFSLKAFPHFRQGADAGGPVSLMGQ